MVPTHGVTYGVFLLANAARHRAHRGVNELIADARRSSAFLAGAVDLRGCAAALVRHGLIGVSEVVHMDPALAALSQRADRATLIGISALLLRRDPPPWLLLAVEAGGISREYIPRDDLRGLEWLDPWLDGLLLSVAAELQRQNVHPVREALGRAGELVVVATAAQAGLTAIHVADISDAFGYDVEIHGTSIQRIEVKSTTGVRRGTFHLSRNEFNRCKELGPEWRLVQVTFDSSVLVAPEITASHVLGIRQLAGSALQQLVPPDSAAFQWTESAIVTAPNPSWSPFQLDVPTTLRVPGMKKIAAERSSGTDRT